MPVSLASVHGECMDARVEATQEQLPDGLSTNPRSPTAHFPVLFRKARKRGGLSFGYFSLATQRKVTRPPQEDETLLLWFLVASLGVG